MRHPCWKLGLYLVLLGLLTHPAAALTAAEVAARLVLPPSGTRHPGKAAPSAAIWLMPLHGDGHTASAVGGTYTLVQKNKQFAPHLLVIPVGSTVHFPNKDPFFHNVFSLFNGRRFDLGLYEAGATRDVTFPREGVSYIFCDIHPEMSAVIVSVATNYYAVADQGSRFRIEDVPPGPYMLHVWVEGENQAALDHLSRFVQVLPGHMDLGAIVLPAQPILSGPHTDKFGQPYDSARAPAY